VNGNNDDDPDDNEGDEESDSDDNSDDDDEEEEFDSNDNSDDDDEDDGNDAQHTVKTPVINIRDETALTITSDEETPSTTPTNQLNDELRECNETTGVGESTGVGIEVETTDENEDNNDEQLVRARNG
jgi:hypothetical protein